MIRSIYSVSQNLDPFTGVTPGVQKCLEGSKTLLIAFLAFLDDALFMPNEILKRFIKKYMDFHQKFAKIEDFKVDYMCSRKNY